MSKTKESMHQRPRTQKNRAWSRSSPACSPALGEHSDLSRLASTSLCYHLLTWLTSCLPQRQTCIHTLKDINIYPQFVNIASNAINLWGGRKHLFHLYHLEVFLKSIKNWELVCVRTLTCHLFFSSVGIHLCPHFPQLACFMMVSV